jgi:hypothetical protein
MRTRALALAAAVLVTAASGAAWAQDAGDQGVWPVKNRLFGKLEKQPKDAQDFAKADDVSGLACSRPSGYPRLCLAVDDETQGAQVVILEDGTLTAGDFIKLSDDSYDGKPLELDAEAVAYADGTFYVLGSHGRPRHETDSAKEKKSDAKAAATRQLFRIKLNSDMVDLRTGALTAPPAISRSTALGALLQADPVLKHSFDAALDDGGLTIEGAAVAQGNLYLGLRGPLLQGGKAGVFAVPVAGLFDGGTPGQTTLQGLDLGTDTMKLPRGIRDLVAFEDGFLVIAGPEQDPPKDKVKPGDYAIYLWRGGMTTKLADLARYGKKLKPEALVPLDRSKGALRALLLFDGGKEGSPIPITLELPE